jgi:RNA-binding protein NOB1
MQVHLKPNFQYKTRGTKYSIPSPKAGSAKTGPGTGLILREDQLEYMRAKKRADGKREREEERLTKGILEQGVNSRGSVSSWMDPDWVPEINSVGSGGKGRTTRNSRMDGDMPQIGYGRKNPNEKRRKK